MSLNDEGEGGDTYRREGVAHGGDERAGYQYEHQDEAVDAPCRECFLGAEVRLAARLLAVDELTGADDYGYRGDGTEDGRRFGTDISCRNILHHKRDDSDKDAKRQVFPQRLARRVCEESDDHGDKYHQRGELYHYGDGKVLQRQSCFLRKDYDRHSDSAESGRH